MKSNAPRVAAALGCGILAIGGFPSGASGHSETVPISQEEIDEALSTPTELTFWTWLPDIQNEVDLFEEAYPAISVTVENVGQGAPHYQQLRAALQAGEGAPDVAQLEYQFIPSFLVTESLLDLTPYGAAELEGDFVPSVWAQVATGGGVWSIPQDTGPMGNLYRADILEQAGVTEPPATWEEYADAAEAVRSSTDSNISNFAPNGPIVGLLWQAGVRPFGYDGAEGVTVNVNSPEAKAVMSYWQDLIQRDLVSVDADFNDNWYQGLANGKYAGWLTAAWGPVFLQGTVADTSGLWSAAPLPQWTAGESASGNWGGSSNAVMATTENPIAAYELARWINTEPEPTLMFATEQFLFPAQNDVLSDPAFLDQESDFFGGQRVNALFAEISTTVDTDFQWLPYMEFAFSSLEETVGVAIAEKGDLAAGLDAWQDALVSYGEEQGFTVNG